MLWKCSRNGNPCGTILYKTCWKTYPFQFIGGIARQVNMFRDGMCIRWSLWYLYNRWYAISRDAEVYPSVSDRCVFIRITRTLCLFVDFRDTRRKVAGELNLFRHSTRIFLSRRIKLTGAGNVRSEFPPTTSLIYWWHVSRWFIGTPDHYCQIRRFFPLPYQQCATCHCRWRVRMVHLPSKCRMT